MELANRHPVSTKAITAAILNFLGDIFCQVLLFHNCLCTNRKGVLIRVDLFTGFCACSMRI